MNMGEGYYRGMEETYSKRLDELLAERDRLKAELAKLKRDQHDCQSCDDRVGILDHENFELKKDRDVWKQKVERLAEALRFLRDYTYTDAEGPELRAQNQRCHMLAKAALDEYGEGK